MLDRLNSLPPDMETGIDGVAQQPENGATTVTKDGFRCFDSPYGAIRDARYIQSRFMSLYITEDNLSEFML